MLTEAMKALRELKLGPMAERLRQWAEDPENTGKSHLECVLALAQAQSQATASRRAHRFLREADLPSTITLADIRASADRGLPKPLLGNLATCDWIQLGQNLVITGETFAGKTYLAGALAREAALSQLSVAYWRTPELLAAAAVEKQGYGWDRFLQRLGRVKLLVLDDFATESSTPEQSHLLRHILDLRSRHDRSVMVVSPNAVEDWDDYFDDRTAADAIFGRVLNRSQRVDLKPHAVNHKELSTE